MFPREAWAGSIYRIGNLTLLESSLNRRVGNSGYAAKVAAYNESNYALSLNILQIAPREWTLDILNARQSMLAQRATHLWRSDFI